MRRFTRYIALVLALSMGSSRAISGDEAPSSFLNGKDLAGWEGLIDDYWSYKDGAIIGIAPQGLKFNTFLCSKKKYGDFELKFQVWLIGKGANSGVQVRSEVFEPKKFAVKGPQCDMGQIYWGSLYGEHFGGMMKAAPEDVVKKVLKDNEYNDYYIKCVGKHVTIKLNGEVTVDGDFDNMPDEGIIGWQLHSGGPMAVIYRNIQFKELRRGGADK